jgi:hypothetical protein
VLLVPSLERSLKEAARATINLKEPFLREGGGNCNIYIRGCI